MSDEKDYTEEEELILGMMINMANQERQDELPPLLSGLVFAVAGISDNPNAFIDGFAAGLHKLRDELIEAGQFPHPENG